jgi:hypothetical protein
MPMPLSPIASPRRRTNQTLMVWRLTRLNEPWPSPRISTNPIASMSRSRTADMNRQASASPAATRVTTIRGPWRSRALPTNGRAVAPARVPMV